MKKDDLADCSVFFLYFLDIYIPPPVVRMSLREKKISILILVPGLLESDGLGVFLEKLYFICLLEFWHGSTCVHAKLS